MECNETSWIVSVLIQREINWYAMRDTGAGYAYGKY